MYEGCTANRYKNVTDIGGDKLRNPILADVFGRMRLMERRGSGFKKILDAYEAEERYKENPSLTQVELSEIMDKSRRTVQMLMKELLDEGTIERIGSKKKGSWLVK
ncbi:MAG: winged helix-turn-helix transcriptional regulator [Lachnospiraceae bacterium]|nr:winged helix-turn-helix transcriptional regulator [Lachnospiraceae bacterium]